MKFITFPYVGLLSNVGWSINLEVVIKEKVPYVVVDCRVIGSQ